MSHKKFFLKAGLLWMTHLHQRRRSSFMFDGRSYSYFNHWYNVTWLNERTVEIPVMREVLRGTSDNVLEVGNVLSCYDRSLTHTVVDKYEKPNRENLFAEDAETFSVGGPYDLIVSISTLEHVGWDETPRDPDKIARTVRNLRRLLSPTGQLVFTAPVGYSPPLDRLIDDGDDFLSRRCLRRISARNEWEEADWDQVRQFRFHYPHPFANGLVIARLKPCGDV